jgi:hypothetical protein
MVSLSLILGNHNIRLCNDMNYKTDEYGFHTTPTFFFLVLR